MILVFGIEIHGCRYRIVYASVIDSMETFLKYLHSQLHTFNFSCGLVNNTKFKQCKICIILYPKCLVCVRFTYL